MVQDQGRKGVSAPAEMTNRIYSVTDFSKIKIKGSWNTTISSGDRYFVQIRALPELLDNNISVVNSNGELNISMENISVSPDRVSTVLIVMPKLSSLSFSGANKVNFRGFDNGGKLDLTTEGLVDLVSEKSTYKDFTLMGKGVNNLDFSDTLFSNAQLYMEGMGKINLHMNGGSLKGLIQGSISLVYSGDISKNELSTTGVSSITRK